jgi:hypothetical protein
MVRNMLAAALLLLCCCPPAAAQTAGCGAIAEASEISEVGAFSNMRYTEEHAYGYTLMLWRTADCFFGVFESSQGLAGDTPIGELQDLKHDRQTGALSFSAKLTTGVVSVSGSPKFEPSRDLFVFDGSLRANTVTGVITYALQNNPNSKPTRSNVILGASTRDAELMHGSTTYGEWHHKWQPVLQSRGPKW